MEEIDRRPVTLVLRPLGQVLGGAIFCEFVPGCCKCRLAMRDLRSHLIGRCCAVIVAVVWTSLATASAHAATVADSVDFTRDVRPILADKCFHCHGPDPESRQADLRLDMWESTDDLLGAVEEVVPGEPDESELVARITAKDSDVRMPPIDSGKTLSPEQIETLKQWIAQGGGV